ncbi:uncharacterized protein [Watersipora subatra]|uniref:uncharacterized protein isoform X2 n=1 Tax=Watersipora subatra TaxID=2589382 RepID=UPI00355B4C48
MAWSMYSFVLLTCVTVAAAQFDTESLIDPGFSFETYPTLTAINNRTLQPYHFATSLPIYYSHIYGSLESSVTGNVTQIKYIASSSLPILFQIWDMKNVSNPQIKAVLPVIPEVGGDDIKTAIPTEDIAIEAGDRIGVWVEYNYPVGTLYIFNQPSTDLFVYHDDWDTKIQPQDAPAGAAKKVTSGSSSAYISALELTITYEVAAQTTTTSTTTTTTTATTTTTTTSATITTPATTTAPTTPVPTTEPTVAPTDTTQIMSSIKTSTEDTTLEKQNTTSSPKVSTDFASSNETASGSKGFPSISGTILYVVIVVPTVTALIMIILITAVVCAAKKQSREIKNFAELKRQYHMDGAISTEPASERIEDLELSGSLRYHQPNVNIAFQSDTDLADRDG